MNSAPMVRAGFRLRLILGGSHSGWHALAWRFVGAFLLGGALGKTADAKDAENEKTGSQRRGKRIFYNLP